MDENDKLHIRLNVYDTVLAVNILRDDEQYYRDAAKLITGVVSSYAARYKGRKSEKEIMYMALIDIALRYERHLGTNDTSVYDDALSKLTREIETALGER